MAPHNANANSNTVRSRLPINLCSIRPAVCNLFCVISCSTFINYNYYMSRIIPLILLFSVDVDAGYYRANAEGHLVMKGQEVLFSKALYTTDVPTLDVRPHKTSNYTKKLPQYHRSSSSESQRLSYTGQYFASEPCVLAFM